MNINANLIKARDGAAPQHKIKGQNRFEATEGSDGAQHIKIVDHNGNPISSNNRLPVDVSFPGTQNVKDDDVKAELEQIKNRLNDKIEVEQSEIAINNLPTDYPDSQVKVELELIKAQQIAINNKLDSIIENDAINTRVTGSNTELIEVWEDFDVPSNATRKLGYVDVSDYKEFYVHVVPGQLNNYTLYRYIRRFDGPDLSRSKIMDRESSANTSSERFEINSIFSTIGVENKTDTDKTFSKIWLFGVKS